MADHMETGLVIDALEMALAGRQAGAGLVVHSDQGVQYASDAYQKVLSANQLVCSMSRRGNCYDNAVSESFFGTFKTEWAYHEQYQTRDQARASVFEYIEVFYNRQRRHSSLGYLSPEAFEAKMN
jgi:putative transposase